VDQRPGQGVVDFVCAIHPDPQGTADSGVLREARVAQARLPHVEAARTLLRINLAQFVGVRSTCVMFISVTSSS
jgi:hypothetical protein